MKEVKWTVLDEAPERQVFAEPASGRVVATIIKHYDGTWRVDVEHGRQSGTYISEKAAKTAAEWMINRPAMSFGVAVK